MERERRKERKGELNKMGKVEEREGRTVVELEGDSTSGLASD